MKRIFYIDEVRQMISQLDKEEITLSKFVELLNEKAMGMTAVQMYQLEQKEKEHERMNCPFKYCDSKPKCEGKCRYS